MKINSEMSTSTTGHFIQLNYSQSMVYLNSISNDQRLVRRRWVVTKGNWYVDCHIQLFNQYLQKQRGPRLEGYKVSVTMYRYVLGYRAF